MVLTDGSQAVLDHNVVCARVALPPPIYYDFGDAPDTYLTLLLSGGPYHLITAGPILGTLIDAEGTGQPSANADLDDLTTSDDEDGVTFPLVNGHRPFIVNEKGQVTVKVSNAPGYLNGWIDWNNNGTFNPEATDHVVQNLYLNPGVYDINFIVPGESNLPAENTTLYSRWRISTEPNAYAGAYGGYMSSGEVEDLVQSVENGFLYPGWPAFFGRG